MPIKTVKESEFTQKELQHINALYESMRSERAQDGEPEVMILEPADGRRKLLSRWQRWAAIENQRRGALLLEAYRRFKLDHESLPAVAWPTEARSFSLITGLTPEEAKASGFDDLFEA